jgi:periplasmic protein TonB
VTLSSSVGVVVLFGMVLQSAATSVSQTERAPEFVRVYPADTPRLVAPTMTHMSHVRYTPEALRARVHGRVALEVTVGQDGHVRDAMITQSLDSTTGMDERAVEAVSQTVFEPGTLDGRPIAVRTTMSFDLTLR